MTLLEVVDAARNLLNEPLESTRTFPDNTSSFWTDQMLMTYHNLIQQEVQQDIVQSYEDYFVTQAFLSVVAGTAEYAQPANTIKVRRVEDVRDAANPVELIPVTLNQRGDEQFEPLNSAVKGAGAYYIRGQQIVLTDTPTFTNASAIRVHYVKLLSDVTAGSGASELPAEHHRVLVWGVVKLALFQQQSDTTIATQEFEKHLTRLRAQVENRQVQRPRRVVRSKSKGDF